jgi:ABC-2 type transport system ATP-binding protein
MASIVQVNHLSKSFGDFKAVDDLCFTVNEGDVYGFLGQNGAGKSTSIRMMLSLIRPDSGEIRMFGKSLFKHRKEILSQTGAIIERPDMYKYLSAFDNLSIFSRMSGKHRSRSELMRMLGFVGLAGREKDKVRAYSQGMKQRLGIAIALIHDPGLVILDEPTNGLDPQGIADMRNLIIDLSRKQGRTVIVSSHLLSEIEMIANRMIIIDRGKKVVEGEVSALLDPSHTVVRIETPDVLRAKEFIKLKYQVSNAEDNIIEVNMNRDEISELIAGLVSANIAIQSVRKVHSLENYFLSLTREPANV